MWLLLCVWFSIVIVVCLIWFGDIMLFNVMVCILKCLLMFVVDGVSGLFLVVICSVVVVLFVCMVYSSLVVFLCV